MGVLDTNVSTMSMAELQQFIASEVNRQLPPIPAGLATLADGDVPLVPPDTAAQGQVIVYDATQGKYIVSNPASIPVVAPGSSPTPTIQGGIGFLIVTYTGVTASGTVTYDVHISTTPGFTPDYTPLTGTFVGNLTGTIMAIRQTPDGVNLQYATDYYCKIVASTTGGSAAASAQGGPVQLTPATNPDIAANAITAGNILAGEITGDKLSANFAIVNTMVAGGVGTQRVEIKATGIQLFASDGTTVQIDIPTTPGQPATFNGNVNTSSLVVRDSLVVQGQANLLDTGSVLTLNEKQSSPTATTPVLSANLGATSIGLATTIGGDTFQNMRACQYDPVGGPAGANTTVVGTLDCLSSSGRYTTYLVEWNSSSGSVLRSVALQTSGHTYKPGVGAVRIGANIYALQWNPGTTAYRMTTVTQATFALTAQTDFNPSTAMDGTGINDSYALALGTDGTNPFIWSFNGSTFIPGVASVNITVPTAPTLGSFTAATGTPVKITTSVNNPGASGSKPIGFSGAIWDGTNWNVSYRYKGSDSNTTDKGTFVQAYTSGFATVAHTNSYYFISSGDEYYRCGFFKDATNNLRLVSRYGIMYTMSSFTWDETLGSKLYAAYAIATELATGSVTVSATSPAVVTLASHGLSIGQEVYFTAGTIPTGFTANQRYFVLTAGFSASTYQVAATRGGTAINASTTGATVVQHPVSESTASSIGVIEMSQGIALAPARRQFVNITPGPLGTATKYYVYGKPGSSAPASTTLRRQLLSNGSVASETAAQIQWNQYDSAALIAPATSTTFAGGTSAVITGIGTAVTAPWQLQGGGTFRLPRATFAQRNSSPTKGDTIWDETANCQAVYDGNGWVPDPVNWPALGGMQALREALFNMAQVPRAIKAQNFEPTIAGSFVTPVAGNRYYASIYWPGGTMTGMAFYDMTLGAPAVYSNTAGSGYSLYGDAGTFLNVTSATTSIARITGAGATSSTVWKPAANGVQPLAFTSPFPAVMPAGIYYIVFFFNGTAITNAPRWLGVAFSSSAGEFYGTGTASGNYMAPNAGNFCLAGVEAGQTNMATSIALATVATAACQTSFWAALY